MTGSSETTHAAGPSSGSSETTHAAGPIAGGHGAVQ